MRLLLFLSCLIMCMLPGPQCFGQNNIAQIDKRLRISKIDTQKVMLLDSMAMYYRDINPDTATIFARAGLELAQQSKYVYGEARIRLLLAQIYGHAANVDDARQEALKAIELFKNIHNEQGVAKSYNQLGVNEGKKGNYDTATRYLMIAERINEKIHDTTALINSYINLGNVITETIDRNKALEYFEKALDLARYRPELRPSILNNIGIIYGKNGQLQRSIAYFDQVLSTTDTSAEFARIRINALGNLVVAYDRLGDHKKAWVYVNEELVLARRYHMREEEVLSLVNLGGIASNTDTAMGLQYLRDALGIATTMAQKPLQIEIYKAFIQIYVDHNDFRHAFFALDKENHLASELFNFEKAHQIDKLHAGYELEKSNIKVEKLELMNQNNEVRKMQILIFAILMTIACLIIVVYYRRTIRLNRQLNIQKNELKDLNTIKDTLFSVIGHDLRSPVGSIVGLLSIWETDGFTEDEKKEVIADLRGQSHAMLETLDKLLNWGQAQLKGVSIFQTEFPPKAVIKDSLHLLKEQAVHKGITITDNTPADTRIFADRLQFDFVIRNLLSNAIKFTHQDGIIEIHADRYSTEGYTIFKIKDNGVGISEERQQTLFGSASVSTLGTANEKGTNIGLKLCKEYVTINGGQIWVESEDGKGTTFCFTMKNRA